MSIQQDTYNNGQQPELLGILAKTWSVALQFSSQLSHVYMEPKLSSYLAKLGSFLVNN